MPFLLGLTTESQALKKQLGKWDKELSEIQRQLSKAKQLIANLAERQGPMAVHRAVIQGIVGIIFNNDRTLRAHASDWVAKIEAAHMGDTRKQYRLVTASAQRLRDEKETTVAIVEAL